MASNSETQINLKTLQRVDSHIIEIIDNASQVAIYKYERQLEKWEGTDIEGALFLYRRSLHPYYGLIIVNRMNTTNFIESFTSDMQFQLQEPYLLYKNHSGDIIGSWFYEQKDLRRITKKIQTIILKQAGSHPRQRCSSESDTKDGSASHNILTLLSQAQDEYMKTVSDTQKANHDPNLNSISNHSEKKSMDKFVGVLSKRPKNSAVRSTSQEEYTTTPHKKFMSTGSLDADRIYDFFSEPDGKIQNTTPKGKETKSKTSMAAKDPEGALPSRGEWGGPTRLSPLFSHDEISSPVSDVTASETPFEVNHSEPIPNSNEANLFSCHSSGVLDWKTTLVPSCDMHFTNMKQVLKSHIQGNPLVMLKIHEAYVSSLKSLFTKN